MMRVISSPSISTTGFFTLIFDKPVFVLCGTDVYLPPFEDHHETPAAVGPGARDNFARSGKSTLVRIVSLLPSVTEILFAIGAGDQVVGVTHECDFPPAARTLPALTSSHLPPELQTQVALANAPAVSDRAVKIDRHVRASVHSGSSLYALDDQALAALAPDIIITQELCVVCAVSYEIVARAARQLRYSSESPAILSLEPSSLADVYANIITVGEHVGASNGAHRLVGALRAREEALRDRAPAPRRPRTLVLEWTDPPMSGGHWTPELVELAGGEPLLANPGANSQRLAWEAIAAADPEVIIVAPCGYALDEARAAVDELADPIWGELRALTNGRAYVMDGNAYVNRPGPRLLDTAEIFAAVIAGEPAPAAAVEPITYQRYSRRR